MANPKVNKRRVASYIGADVVDPDEWPVARPFMVSGPTVTGTAKVGETLTASPGTWQGAPTYAYQWLADGVAISGATSATYEAAEPDEGKVIVVRVTATNAGGSAVATSAATEPVEPADEPEPEPEPDPEPETPGDDEGAGGGE